MAKRFFQKKLDGQLMLEVLIVIAILSVVMVVATRRIGQSVRDATSSNDRIEAIRYAQDAAEWLKHWRDVNGFDSTPGGLVNVAGIASLNDTNEVCWDDDTILTGDGVALPAVNTPSEFDQGCPSSSRIADFFTRRLELRHEQDAEGRDFVNFAIFVSWFDGGREQDVSVTGNIYDTD